MVTSTLIYIDYGGTLLPVRIYNPACFYPGSHLGSFELFLSGFPLLGIPNGRTNGRSLKKE
jgi:hypothetical protein